MGDSKAPGLYVQLLTIWIQRKGSPGTYASPPSSGTKHTFARYSQTVFPHLVHISRTVDAHAVPRPRGGLLWAVSYRSVAKDQGVDDYRVPRLPNGIVQYVCDG